MSTETENIVAVFAADRASLIRHVDRIIDGMAASAAERFVYCRCELPCGTVREYSRDSVPEADDECLCGAPYRHWFVKYGDLDGCFAGCVVATVT